MSIYGELELGSTTPTPTPTPVPELARIVQESRPQPKKAEVQAANRRSELIGYCGTEAIGHLVGWRGHGELTLGAMQHACQVAGLSNMAPKPKSARAHLGMAVACHNREGRIARALRRPGPPVWEIVVRGHEGWDVVCTATLFPGGGCLTEGNSEIGYQIASEYTRLAEAEIYQAGQITDWLHRVARSLQGVRLGSLGTYLPQSAMVHWTPLVETLCWGLDWGTIPVTDSEGLARSLHNSLNIEVNTLIDGIAEELPDMTPRVARARLASIEELRLRCTQYAAILGEDRMARALQVLKASAQEMTERCDRVALMADLDVD